MSKHVDSTVLREMSPSPDKFFAFEREVIGAINREVDQRKEKAESVRMTREKKAKRKRQRAAASMG